MTPAARNYNLPTGDASKSLWARLNPSWENAVVGSKSTRKCNAFCVTPDGQILAADHYDPAARHILVRGAPPPEDTNGHILGEARLARARGRLATLEHIAPPGAAFTDSRRHLNPTFGRNPACNPASAN
jgi:hypothetical protein